MPAEKTSSTGSRRGSKPLVEKKRRARINQSLAELQSLILISKKEGRKQSRIEKADILEMTVRYLQSIQKEQRENVSSSSSSSSSPSSPSSSSSSSSPSQSSSYFSKFRAGYLECVSEVNRYLTTVEKLDACVYERLRRHLLVRLRQVEDLSTATERISLTDVKIEDSDSRNSPNVTTTTPTTPSPSPSPSSTLSSSCSQVTVDSTSSVPSITSLGLSVSCTEALAGVAVIPSRLSTGQLAFVVPTKEYLQYINKFGPPTIHDLTLMRGHESSSSFSGLSSSSSSSSTSPSSSSLSLTSLMMTSSTSQCPEVPNPRVVRLIEPTWGGDRTNVWRPW